MIVIINKTKLKEIKKAKLGHSRGHIPEKYEEELFGKLMWESEIVKSKEFDGRYYAIGLKNRNETVPHHVIQYANMTIEKELAKRARKYSQAFDIACKYYQIPEEIKQRFLKQAEKEED